MRTIKRIGPQMARAIEYVREHPGCTKRAVAVTLHPAAANGNSMKCGYNPVNRAIRAGHIKAERVSRVLYRLTLAVAMLTPSLASAAPKGKPSVCENFRVFQAEGAVMGVCYDSSKPAIWSSWTLVDVTDPQGAKRRYAVGYR